MTIFIVYSGDAWLSRDSLDIKAVCLSREDAIGMIMDNTEMDEEEKDGQLNLLNIHGQTYGLDTNFTIGQIDTDIWL